ncbi:hypothetical protein K431DRAFT_242130 [Polychaeton citri CBS 116435]|uniref:Uncharacterized protein n=1 Tax=Polychaeton citri CBS 116435 TaxID=1314669 RepID=A0A9P4QFG5_9PEZI|nr:hypothetical protein K431DRAFT_242130 [Polychaeton citri CBS 116435]
MFALQPGPRASFPPSQPSHGPPPLKKQKGNTIITRYPPPLGYKGPAQPGASATPPVWQPHARTFNYGHVSPQHQRSYSFPHLQQSYVGSQQTYPVAQTFYPSPLTPGQPAPTQSWPTAQGRRNTVQVHTPLSAEPLDGNGDPFPPLTALPEDGDSTESDYDSECYFARHPDEINPALSIGTIEWEPAKHTRYALPATFALAEIEAIAPRRPPPPGEESPSEYFHHNKQEEALLSVRQTDWWEVVKGDDVYVEFPTLPSILLTAEEVYSRYRYQHDPEWEVAERRFETPSSSSRHSTPMLTHTQIDDGSSVRDGATDMLDDLEQALGTETLKAPTRSIRSPGRTYDRPSSSRLTYPEKLTRPKPLPLIRDQAQEDILATLGVTGSPKTVFQTPGPAFGPPPDDLKSLQATRKRGREGSSTSSHDLEVILEDVDTTPPPQSYQQDSRKRAHDDFEGPHPPENQRYDDDDDDATPRPRFKHQRF